MAFCAADMFLSWPSCGVHSHQTSAKKAVHEVEKTWSAKKKWAIYRDFFGSSCATNCELDKSTRQRTDFFDDTNTPCKSDESNDRVNVQTELGKGPARSRQHGNESIHACNLVQQLERELSSYRWIDNTTYGKQQGNRHSSLQVEDTEERGDGPQAPFRAQHELHGERTVCLSKHHLALLLSVAFNFAQKCPIISITVPSPRRLRRRRQHRLCRRPVLWHRDHAFSTRSSRSASLEPPRHPPTH